ncbi:neurogenic locus notch homolog protein 1-like [Dendronephthya gigantea]|uniref:neurogenic locus notch homolog protein 1-like n=1 Tax=Dendronephthya gigantea TaxID=151771 RepID=UPI00106DC5FE|nr:neurogenic locus notch homolog protein 1-like [Dendronephthya gigantea]XP_028408047.1 neurogenic locus notch homolog protein 1-like [Dendronephthya gigantea]
MVARSFPRWLFRSCVILGLGLLCRNVWCSLCHREYQYMKLNERAYPQETPLKITTTSRLEFCSFECTHVSGCRSLAFLTTTNTNNCHLGSSKDGIATSTEAVVYRRRTSGMIEGCQSSPCLNGGTCVDLCEEPYHLCHCPADKQGPNCEHDINCFNLNWWDQFDHAGTHTCSGKTYLVGLKRSDCASLSCIEEPVCCPLQFEYSTSSMSCQNGDWWNTFAHDAWNWCPANMAVRGFYRAGGTQDLGYIEEGVCCKPDDAAQLGDCYYEDITLTFDNPHSTVRCQKQFYYIHGIRTSACQEITCIEELQCCRFL